MTYAQVFNFYKDKRGADKCKLTNELIKYLRYGDYIQVAIVSGVTTPPSQWWHLMQYVLKYYESGKENNTFNANVACGELIFWMAEVSGAFEEKELIRLKESVISTSNQTVGDKNKMIKEYCWERIKNEVESSDNKQQTTALT